MPSNLHEAFIELVRQRPEFVAEVLAGQLGVALPEFGETRLDSIDFTNVLPTEYRADAVVTFTVSDRPVFAVVVEAQLRRSARKRLTWPVYLTSLRARLGCTTALLVLCDDSRVAGWCAQPIDVAYPDCRVTPLVLGPDRVPVVTDPTAATNSPELTVLSALAHGGGPARLQVFEALLAALQKIDTDHNRYYYDLVLAALPAAARHDLEEHLMTMTANKRYRSDFLNDWADEHRAEGWDKGLVEGRAAGMNEGRAQGRAEGEVLAVLAVLAARGVPVSNEARDRISACKNLAQLDVWVQRAVTVTDIDELFRD